MEFSKYWDEIAKRIPIRYLYDLHKTKIENLNLTKLFGFKMCKCKRWKMRAACWGTAELYQDRASGTMQSDVRLAHGVHCGYAPLKWALPLGECLQSLNDCSAIKSRTVADDEKASVPFQLSRRVLVKIFAGCHSNARLMASRFSRSFQINVLRLLTIEDGSETHHLKWFHRFSPTTNQWNNES